MCRALEVADQAQLSPTPASPPDRDAQTAERFRNDLVDQLEFEQSCAVMRIAIGGILARSAS